MLIQFDFFATKTLRGHSNTLSHWISSLQIQNLGMLIFLSLSLSSNCIKAAQESNACSIEAGMLILFDVAITKSEN